MQLASGRSCHTDRIVVAIILIGARGSWPRERTNHWLAIDLASIPPDHHFHLRAFLLYRMRVIYSGLQELAAVGLELSGLRRRGNLSALLILRRDILLLRWCVLQVVQVI